MAACPKCAASIDADFGVLNCPSCGAMLSVNFDGSVDLSEDGDNLEENRPEEIKTNEDTQSFAQDFSFSEAPSGDDTVEVDPAEESLAKQEEQSFLGQEEIPEEPIAVSDNNDFMQEPEVNVFEEEEVEKTRVLEREGFEDVEAFGNSDISSQAGGGVLYDLRIEGIDSAEIREEIRLELSDKKYRLNASGLLKSTQDGILTIRGLNAVKAALIVRNLKHLNIEMQWKQNEVIRM